MKDFFNADADLNSEAVSAVDKSPKASLKEQVAGYRQRAEAMGAVVKKANDDYRDYLLSKKR
ncbi:MAG: hypothetical protein HY075_02175 [Deltaproteobacteria bacterium]|nr:hypothetical protein [Deltaproteobacteria bacterium]